MRIGYLQIDYYENRVLTNCFVKFQVVVPQYIEGHVACKNVENDVSHEWPLC